MKTNSSRYETTKNRYFASDGIEVWRWNNEWLVLSKAAPRYGKFYSLRNAFKSLFDIDSLLKQTYHGVMIKSDPSPLDIDEAKQSKANAVLQ